MKRTFQRLLAALLCVAIGLAALPAHAHAFTPFVLELRERPDGSFEAELRRPLGQASPQIDLPAECTLIAEAPEHVVHHCPRLRGARIVAREMDVSELLVRVHFVDGASTSTALHHENDAFVVPAAPEPPSLGAFVALGTRHILSGFDHLAFLAVLALLVGARAKWSSGWRRLGPLAGALTAFTVAHSVTLGLAAFGVARIAPTLAEPLIALSVVFLAAELVRSPRGSDPSLLARRPALAAFGFGLLHGTGFASGLADAGVTRSELPRALFGFNVGVELGQVAFVAAFLLGVALLGRVRWVSLLARPRLVGYATGALAAAWTIERLGEVLR